MNKRIDFTNLGGNPIDQDALDFMQISYRSAFAGIASLCGNKVILTGVQVIGPNVTSGWIVYNGEMIPFAGGGFSPNVVIEETSESVTFLDNQERAIYFTKTARCGTPGTFPFSDLQRLNTIQELKWLPGDLKQVNCDADYITANFSAGGVGINERAGWKICDAMGGRVAVGYSTVTIDPGDNVWDAIYRVIGATGGEKKHKLTIAELAKHKHQYNRPRTDPFTTQYEPNKMNDGNDVGLWVGDAVNTSEVGNDDAHENRQPFKVILYIEKL